jgi:hypothetical protein
MVPDRLKDCVNLTEIRERAVSNKDTRFTKWLDEHGANTDIDQQLLLAIDTVDANKVHRILYDNYFQGIPGARKFIETGAVEDAKIDLLELRDPRFHTQLLFKLFDHCGVDADYKLARILKHLCEFGLFPEYRISATGVWRTEFLAVVKELDHQHEQMTSQDEQRRKFAYSTLLTILKDLRKVTTNRPLVSSQLRKKSKWLACCCSIVGIIVGVLCSYMVGYSAVQLGKILQQPCPMMSGRVCNGQGVCEDGVCLCENPLFSGPVCGDTLIPAYDPLTNSECNGHGQGYPFITPADECVNADGIIDWTMQTCIDYVGLVREKYSKWPIAGQARIPWCLCYPEWTGIKCQFRSCPVDENAKICGDHGNKSVGLFKNTTREDQNGCQCGNPVRLDRPPYTDYLNPVYLDLLKSRFYYQFQQPYCVSTQVYSGNTSYNITFNSTVATQSNSYRCYCDGGWQGPVCTDSLCPRDSSNNICSGNGNPFLGQGLKYNTTDSSCNIRCWDPDATNCNGACLSQSWKRKQQCVVPQCPPQTPIRCFDSTCQAIPRTKKGCLLNYQTGFIDPAQLSIPISEWVCNVTSAATFADCFGFLPPQGTQYLPGGWFSWDPLVPLQVDLESPLIYYQFSTTSFYPSVVQLWTPLINVNQTAGTFNYPPSLNWVTTEWSTVVNSTSQGYLICYVDANATSGQVPTNYTLIKLQGALTNATNTFQIQSSTVNLTLYADEEYQIMISGTTTQESFYSAVTGDLVSQVEAFAYPELVSWLYSPTEDQIRTADSSWYICALVDPGPFVQPTPCPYNYTAYKSLVEGYIWHWGTCLLGALEDGPLQDDSYDLFSYYYKSTSYPFNLTFGDDNVTTILIASPAFLTLDRISYPCACPQISGFTNWSTLNEVWWLNQLRIPDSTVEVGDYALIRDQDGQYLRTRIEGVDPIGSTLLLVNPQYNITTTSFFSTSRTLTPGEFLLGYPDCDPMQYPVRCPDGQCSQLQVYQRDVESQCNCTYAPPLFSCNCSDISNQTWGCQCLSDFCECGLPALPEFQRTLLDEFTRLKETACQCIIYNPLDITNQSVLVQANQSYELNITYGLDQVPEFLVVKTTGDGCELGNFTVIGLNEVLFVNISTGVSFLNGTNSACEHWLTLLYPAEIAIDRLLVQSVYPMSWVSLLFGVYGFSLTNLDYNFTFTASSNSEDSWNVDLRNGTYWLSSELDEQPSIEVEFTRNFYVQSSHIIFYQAGQIDQNTTFPYRIYLQGYTGSQWTTLASVGVYCEAGGWSERALTIDVPDNYYRFRLISPSGQFGVREWKLYSNQVCTCDDGSLVSMQWGSLVGLPTIQSQLTSIEDITIISNPGCLCENNCTIKTGANIYQDVANDGVCQDAINIDYLLGLTPVTRLVNTTYQNLTTAGLQPMPYWLYTSNVSTGIDSVQFAASPSQFLPIEDQFQYFQRTQGYNFFLGSNVSAYNQTIYFLNQTNNLQVILPDPITTSGAPYYYFYYVNNTDMMLVEEWIVDYQGVLENGYACIPGMDCADCGCNLRSSPVAPLTQCTFSYSQLQLLTLIQNGSIFVNQTYYVKNLTALQNWTATYQSIPLVRKENIAYAANCPDQVCPYLTPYRCPNGQCVQYPSECQVRYDCPGNGCVQQYPYNSYRCACKLGTAGESCQFGIAKPATPYLEITQQGAVPGQEEIKCGGPPALKIQPPILNRMVEPTVEQIVAENNLDVIGSPKKSPFQVNYLRVMPNSGWGQTIRYAYNLYVSNILADLDQYIYTTCPPMRRGAHGEYVFLTEDIVSEDPLTGQVLEWRQSPECPNGVCIWYNIVSYNDFPYRCPNGQCTKDVRYCALSAQIFPVCNGQGVCMADDSCQCFPGRKTLAINEAITTQMGIPYSSELGFPNPTVWEMNWNWKHFGLSWCLGRDCSGDNCLIPAACYPGTPEREFKDALVQCPAQSGRQDKCAPTEIDCYAGTNLQLPLQCAGNGIPRVKDFTGETYCYCGSPISPQATIADITQITDLKKNGWGGPNCNIYFASPAPLYWSEWDYLVDQPYFSAVTGRPLPGRWIQGNMIVGPDPNQRGLLEGCCQKDRFEECDKVVCLIGGKYECKPNSECQPDGGTPQIFPCNNHGTARADGTCLCDRTGGSGYTHDYTQFSDAGCYRYFECPTSPLTGKTCNQVSACGQPEEWRYPAPQEQYFKQQAYQCGPQQGLVSNATLLNQIQTSQNQFQDQLRQAFTVVAIQVQDSIAALQNCICVYPNDTETSKTAMIPGVSYVYKEPYVAPFMLPLAVYTQPSYVIDYTRFDIGQTKSFAPGESWLFYTQDNNFTVSSIRIFGTQTSPTVIQLVTLYAVAICSPLATSSNTTSGFILFPGQCAPQYVCEPFSNNPLYPSYCSNPTSIICLDWKASQCILNGYNYRPPGSPAIYDGCTCSCCKKKTGDSYPHITSGIILMTNTGNSTIYIGTVQIFGYGAQAQALPTLLNTKLKNTFPTSVVAGEICQDYLFLSSFLGSNNGYIQVPYLLNSGYDFVTAYQKCRDYASYLAIPQSSLSTTPLLFQQQCNSQLQLDKGCWVGARAIDYFDATTTRTQLFKDQGSDYCTSCYVPSLTTAGYIMFSFSTWPYTPMVATKYKQAEFTGQIAAPLESIPTKILSPIGDSILTSCGALIFFQYTIWTSLDDVSLTPCSVEAWVELTMTRDTFPFMTTMFNMRVQIPAYGTFIDYYQLSALINPYEVGTVLDAIKIRSLFPANAAWLAQAKNFFPSWAPVAGLGYPQSQTEPCFQHLFWSSGSSACLRNRDISLSPSGALGAESPYYVLAKYSSCYGNDPFHGYKFTSVPVFCNPNGESPPPVYPDTVTFGCIRVFPFYNWNEILYTPYTAKYNDGYYGGNWRPGYKTYPYIPLFLELKYGDTHGAFVGKAPPATYLLQKTQPVYFTINPATKSLWGTITQTFTSWSAALPICTACFTPLNGAFYWLNDIYTLTSRQVDSPPLIDLYMTGYVPGIPLSTNLLREMTIEFQGHLVTYLQSRTNQTLRTSGTYGTQTQYYQWYLGSCMAVNSGGFITRPCQNWKLQPTCQLDYLSLAIKPGYEGPLCGPNAGRDNGYPAPGKTCFDTEPLANATLYPTEHSIYNHYLTNTLDLYIESIAPPTDVDLLHNRSIIWAIPSSWEKWAKGYSSRSSADGGRLSPNTVAELNWCDFDLNTNFPVDCQAQGYSILNPATNEVERACVAESVYCDLTIQTGPNPNMSVNYIPPLFSPVNQSLALTTPSCGYPVFLNSYTQMDRFGAPQGLTNFSILSSTDQEIKLQIQNQGGLYYNSGKTPTQFRFVWNQTAYISGVYDLYCPTCVGTEQICVLIHPLTREYAWPHKNLTQCFLAQQGRDITFTVSFLVTSDDTGSYYSDGEWYPLYPFRGVALLLEFPQGTLITLQNPIISTAETQLQCVNQQPPLMVEARPRIISTAPYRPCIDTDDLVYEYPGTQIGDCGCDISTGGRTCTCPATTTEKYGKMVCGGFGCSNCLTPAGTFTLDGDESGCYFQNNKALCQTIDIGTAMFTTWVPEAPFSSPSVYIDAPPQDGISLFFPIAVSSPVGFEEARLLCFAEQAYLPFYYTADELGEMLDAISIPSFISVNHTTNQQKWPWLANLDGYYFINGDVQTVSNTSITTLPGDFNCTSSEDLTAICLTANFQNLAYDTTKGCLQDGNTYRYCSASYPTTIVYSSLATLEVQVYIFGATGITLSCEGSSLACSTATVRGTDVTYTCRCPTRELTFTAPTGGTPTEIQIFSTPFSLPTSVYPYQ